MNEHLVRICVPGSVVEFQDSLGVCAAELLSGGAQVDGQGPLVPARHFFEIVSHSLVSKKFISTGNLLKMKRMHCPIVLQRLTLCDGTAGGQDLPQSVIAFPEGHPEVQDVRTFGSWRDLRRRSHGWSVEAVTDDGSLRLTARQSLGQLVWTHQSCCPLWVNRRLVSSRIVSIRWVSSSVAGEHQSEAANSKQTLRIESRTLSPHFTNTKMIPDQAKHQDMDLSKTRFGVFCCCSLAQPSHYRLATGYPP